MFKPSRLNVYKKSHLAHSLFQRRRTTGSPNPVCISYALATQRQYLENYAFGLFEAPTSINVFTFATPGVPSASKYLKNKDQFVQRISIKKYFFSNVQCPVMLALYAPVNDCPNT